jgi:PTH1 family peptidyl-tRNA hydrolase
MKYLIVGLGNIGPEYADNRHNIGFMVLDELAKKAGVSFTTMRLAGYTEVSFKGKKIFLIKPNTFMNCCECRVRQIQPQQEDKGKLVNKLLLIIYN